MALLGPMPTLNRCPHPIVNCCSIPGQHRKGQIASRAKLPAVHGARKGACVAAYGPQLCRGRAGYWTLYRN
eukprot:12935923-Prorocentrum_lima.AAC.1